MQLTPEQLTAERRKTHGSFADHSRYTMRIKEVLNKAEEERFKRGQPPLTDQQREALDMIAHKIGRILAGQSSLQDHWDDIAGYAHIANKDFGDNNAD